MLTPSENQEILSKWSSKLAHFDCSCGNKNVLKIWSKVINGHTTTCGECNLVKKEFFEKTKFGNLKMKFPKDYKSGSNQIVEWACNCGRTTRIKIGLVTGGYRKSCGKCNELDEGFWEENKFGKLKLKTPVRVHKSSNKKLIWVCDCGKETVGSVIDVTNGHKSSCGKCSTQSVEYWKITKFGKLKLADPIELAIYSNKKVKWLCDCGNEHYAIVSNVTKKRITSCGKCRNKIDEWFQNNKETIRKLKPPIKQENLPEGTLTIIEKFVKTDLPTKVICSACGNEYKPRWDHIRSGRALTCGCSTNRISLGQQEILGFLKNLGFEVATEFDLNKLRYDLFVINKKLLIEFQGLHWHSSEKSKERDKNKYENAVKNGYSFTSIFEDEWVQNQTKIENLLTNKLGLSKPQKVLRPSKTEIRKIKSSESNVFYDKFHYIGPCRSKINFGVFYGNELVACCSFSNPTRQSKYEWELVRMASNPEYKIHGIWSKILKIFIKENKAKDIVSFSDNRLFDGRTYEKIGFKFDGNVPQDYYWVKGNKRFHKSGLRKQKEEIESGLTETQLRESQGYKKVWDVGKKRWVLTITEKTV